MKKKICYPIIILLLVIITGFISYLTNNKCERSPKLEIVDKDTTQISSFIVSDTTTVKLPDSIK